MTSNRISFSSSANVDSLAQNEARTRDEPLGLCNLRRLGTVKGDREAEAIHHRGELLRAAVLLTTNFADISVEPYFVKFDGIWEVQDAARAKAASKVRTA